MKSDTQKILYKIGCAEHVVQDDLEGLVSAWVKVVAHVSEGYQMTTDDYLNDIEGRHLIHVFIDQAPSQFIAPYEQRLKAADEKFMVCTTETVECIWGHAMNKNITGHAPPIGIIIVSRFLVIASWLLSKVSVPRHNNHIKIRSTTLRWTPLTLCLLYGRYL